ncbi:MAG TPA: hypothetical protein VIE88_12025 [Vicinamibacteria bacterium]|jgi:hypothetical protein
MGKINMGRVLLGGLVAGLVMNVSETVLHAGVLAADGAKLIEEWGRLGLKAEMRPSLLVWLVGITFVLGILAVWTYAAIRPRYGAGPKTALCAGLAVWAMSYLYAGVYVHAGIVVVPPKLTWVPVAWSLVEVPLATLLGAWLYRE